MMIFDISTDLIKPHAVHLDAFNFRMFVKPLFDQVIGAVAFVGDFIFHERIIEGGYVTGGDLGFRMKQDLGVDPDHVLTGGNHLMPP